MVNRTIRSGIIKYKVIVSFLHHGYRGWGDEKWLLVFRNG